MITTMPNPTTSLSSIAAESATTNAGASPARPQQCHSCLTRTQLFMVAAVCCTLFSATTVSSFSPSSTVSKIQHSGDPHATNESVTHHKRPIQQKAKTSTELSNLFPKDDFDKDAFLDDDDDEDDVDYAVKAQISKANALIQEAKTKLEKLQNLAESEVSSEKKENEATLPFFAVRSFTSSASENAKKIKKKTSSGVVADGETMASLSRSEPWERRTLSSMSNDEKSNEKDKAAAEAQKRTEKDLAMGIWNLRRQLGDADFKKVFDSRNRFIGELD